MDGKNSPGLYDGRYLAGDMSADHPGLRRDDDNGLYYAVATRAVAVLDGLGIPPALASVLDVGCGRGFVVRHLRRMGLWARGCEYGEAARATSVCAAQFCDLADPEVGIPVSDGSAALVICHGVLSHLPPERAEFAASELKRVAAAAVWTNVLVDPHASQRHHLTVRPREWWRPILSAGGWTEEAVEGFGAPPYQWSALWRAP